MFRIYILIFGVVAIGSAVAGGYWYVSKIQEEKEYYKGEMERIELAFEMQGQLLANLQLKVEEQQKLRQSLETKLSASRQQAKKAQKVFAKHDLEKLMVAKRETVTKLMQRSTKEVFSQLEAATQ